MTFQLFSRFINNPEKNIRSEFNLAKNILHERALNIPALVMRYGCGTSIWVPIENMTPLTTHYFETQSE